MGNVTGDPRLPPEQWNTIDDHLSARHVHEDRTVHVAAPVPCRKHDVLTLDGHRQRFHFLFPARRQVSRASELLGEALGKIPIAWLVVPTDDPDIMRLE